MRRNTFVKQTQVWLDSGYITVSIYKQRRMADGTMTEQAHRMTLTPDDDLDHVIEANNAHLISMGYPPIDMAELDVSLSLRRAALDLPKPKDGEVNPIHSVELNHSGGMRLMVKMLDDDDSWDPNDERVPIIIGPLDEIGDRVEEGNAKLVALGYKTLEMSHLLPVEDMRSVAHSIPFIQRGIQIERERVAEIARLQAEQDAKDEQARFDREDALRLEAEEINAELDRNIENMRIEAEKQAAENAQLIAEREAARKAEDERIQQMVEAQVQLALDRAAAKAAEKGK